MLEIIAIVFLCRHHARLCREKGYHPTGYVVLTVLLWIGFEVIGAIVGGIIAYETTAIYILALLGAGVGALVSHVIVRGLTPKESANQDLTYQE